MQWNVCMLSRGNSLSQQILVVVRNAEHTFAFFSGLNNGK
jgi:hypothetical protein